MSTQYHLGWIYHDLGDYDKAIESYSEGIPEQPDFMFVYWRRALSYDAKGLSVLAKQDLDYFIGLYKKLIKEDDFNRHKGNSIPQKAINEITPILIKYGFEADILS